MRVSASDIKMRTYQTAGFEGGDADMTWMLEQTSELNHAVKLRELLKSGETLSVPGVFNPMTAMIARKVGFDTLYFSGAAFSASLGIPDIGIFTLAELTDAAAASPAATIETLRQRLKEQVAELLRASTGIPEDRLTQEAALLATKFDIREEIDRLEKQPGI